jgi:hypothetical protein
VNASGAAVNASATLDDLIRKRDEFYTSVYRTVDQFELWDAYAELHLEMWQQYADGIKIKIDCF